MAFTGCLRGLGRQHFACSVAAALLGLAAGCDSGRDKLPGVDTAEHRDAVTAFRVGVAAFQVGDDARAEKNLSELTRLAPGEPAGWASWAALALRQGKLDAAEARLYRAIQLAPKHAELRYLRGLLRILQGRGADAVASFTEAAERDPNDPRFGYALAQQVERQGGADADQRAQSITQKLLAQAPGSLALLVDVARLAAKRGDAQTLRPIAEQLARLGSAWPSEVQEQAQLLQQAALGADLRAAAIRTTRLRNVLLRVPEYRESLDAIKPPAVAETPPFTRLLALADAPVRAAPADTGLRFSAKPVAAIQGTPAWLGAIQLGSAGAPAIAAAVKAKLTVGAGAVVEFPGDAVAAGPDAVLRIDFTYDFKTDLVLAGPSGVRLYRQDDAAGTFSDATVQSKLPRTIVNGAYRGAWAADIEADGDLDIVLGTAHGEPVVLQNNGDSTFDVIAPFKGVDGVSQFLWADLDGDGTPEAMIVDAAGQLHVFINRRQGQFRERAVPPKLGVVRALAVIDGDHDGRWELLVARADGVLSRLVDHGESKPWEIAEVARVPQALREGEVRLRVADLDNNGAVDIVLMRVHAAAAQSVGAVVWLAKGEAAGYAEPLLITAGASVSDIADLDGDGRLDLLGTSAQGAAVQLINSGSFAYHWQVIRPRAAQAFGDQRINPFGVGGDVEVRAGSVVQKRPITGPVVHFGLGNQSRTDIIRVHWPHGVVQAEFDAQADQAVATEQRLKGSCPFLFAWDGTRMNFVKDAVPWGSAIGLRINTIGTASIAATEEWYRVGRDQLVARDGHYDLRITAELWEVYYYDQFSLMTVDHPEGTEVFVDERFVIPPVKPQVVVVATPQPLASAVDDRGQDVSETLAALDGRSVDSFGRGQYQGVTRDHYVELELGDKAVAAAGPLYLVAHGSLRPTDSSINVALSQGTRWSPQGMSLEVPDARGGWRIARKDLGFPAGRKKIVLFDLTDLFPPGAPRRARIRTNLEIYWDKIEWAVGRPDVAIEMQALEPSTADLHYRGYSVLNTPPAGAPEVPDYDLLAGTARRWRDLVGYYTRYGDVKELLRDADDRYVIVNAGDEMSFRFPAPAAPATGWVRDFVVKGDGWIKDGDYNSGFSRTVQPLPHHDERDYTTPVGRLEDEVAWRKNPQDWVDYHTRYVTDRAVVNALQVERARP